MRTDWLNIVFLQLDRNTELAQAMMTRTKKIHILVIKVNKLFATFSSQCIF